MCLIFIFMHIYNLNKQDFFEIFTSQPPPPFLKKKSGSALVSCLLSFYLDMSRDITCSLLRNTCKKAFVFWVRISCTSGDHFKPPPPQKKL